MKQKVCCFSLDTLSIISTFPLEASPLTTQCTSQIVNILICREEAKVFLVSVRSRYISNSP
jgi:hypothetical protein